VIVLSPDMAASVTSRFPGLDVSVIPNACDVAAFAGVTPAEVTAFRAARAWLGDRPLVVYTGTIGAVNNVGYVVELARRLRHRDPDVRFLVVGDGKERAEVERLARRGGVLDTNLFMEPPVPKRAVPALLAAADLAMSTVAPIPELYANSANKVFDAIAAGCPVVINHDGWLRDVLEESGAGFALPAGDPDVGASVLAERVRDAGWLDRAGAACRRLASERFDRGLLFDRFERVLLHAARESRPNVAHGDRRR
jgi:glycosyltransferase involved in cell wall biosynthesis